MGGSDRYLLRAQTRTYESRFDLYDPGAKRLERLVVPTFEGRRESARPLSGADWVRHATYSHPLPDTFSLQQHLDAWEHPSIEYRIHRFTRDEVVLEARYHRGFGLRDLLAHEVELDGHTYPCFIRNKLRCYTPRSRLLEADEADELLAEIADITDAPASPEARSLAQGSVRLDEGRRGARIIITDLDRRALRALDPHSFETIGFIDRERLLPERERALAYRDRLRERLGVAIYDWRLGPVRDDAGRLRYAVKGHTTSDGARVLAREGFDLYDNESAKRLHDPLGLDAHAAHVRRTWPFGLTIPQGADPRACASDALDHFDPGAIDELATAPIVVVDHLLSLPEHPVRIDGDLLAVGVYSGRERTTSLHLAPQLWRLLEGDGPEGVVRASDELELLTGADARARDHPFIATYAPDPRRDWRAQIKPHLARFDLDAQRLSPALRERVGALREEWNLRERVWHDDPLSLDLGRYLRQRAPVLGGLGALTYDDSLEREARLLEGVGLDSHEQVYAHLSHLARRLRRQGELAERLLPTIVEEALLARHAPSWVCRNPPIKSVDAARRREHLLRRWTHRDRHLHSILEYEERLEAMRGPHETIREAFRFTDGYARADLFVPPAKKVYAPILARDAAMRTIDERLANDSDPLRTMIRARIVDAYLAEPHEMIARALAGEEHLREVFRFAFDDEHEVGCYHARLCAEIDQLDGRVYAAARDLLAGRAIDDAIIIERDAPIIASKGRLIANVRGQRYAFNTRYAAIAPGVRALIEQRLGLRDEAPDVFDLARAPLSPASREWLVASQTPLVAAQRAPVQRVLCEAPRVAKRKRSTRASNPVEGSDPQLCLF